MRHRISRMHVLLLQIALLALSGCAGTKRLGQPVADADPAGLKVEADSTLIPPKDSNLGGETPPAPDAVASAPDQVDSESPDPPADAPDASADLTAPSADVVDTNATDLSEGTDVDGGETKKIFVVDGDLNGDGVVNVADVQCQTLVKLWLDAGATDPVPLCAKSLEITDLNCDGIIDLQDTLARINLAMGVPLDPSVDADGDNIDDACQ